MLRVMLADGGERRTEGFGGMFVPGRAHLLSIAASAAQYYTCLLLYVTIDRAEDARRGSAICMKSFDDSPLFRYDKSRLVSVTLFI